MKLPKYHRETHQCAPKDWRKTPKITGDYDFDASIKYATKNKDAEHKIVLFANRSYSKR